MKKLYLECNTGISGDMFVAALLDLGVDKAAFLEAMDSIPLDGYKITMDRVQKNGIDCMNFSVNLDEKYENHDADMEYLYGHEREHDHSQEHHHEHRGLKDVIEIINQSGKLSARTKELAISIFTILGEAEAKAHGKTLEDVHFHEVGAVDSIVDIVAAAYCIDALEIEEAYIPYLTEGSGTIRCAHGILSVPVPAVVHIASAHHLPLKITNRKGELITPTGAAIAAMLMSKEKTPEIMRFEAVGIGAGKREYEIPSMVRACLLCEEQKQDDIYKLESNIDDCTGENLGYVMELLMDAGARDVHYTPVFMKKNRPAYQLNVVCSEDDVEKLEHIIFRETTTIGIRRLKVERSVLARRIVEVNTPYGTAKCKVCIFDGEMKIYPEYESVKELCAISGCAYSEMFQMILQCGIDQIEGCYGC